MNGDLKIFPQSGYTIVVLANLDPPSAGRISDFIAKRLPLKSVAAGTWQGNMDGLPVVTLTVQDDAGALSGTVTFSRIVDDGSGPRIDGRTSTPIINPVLDGKTLCYQVKNPKDELTTFKLELTAENEGVLKGGRMRRNAENGPGEEAPPLKMVRDH